MALPVWFYKVRHDLERIKRLMDEAERKGDKLPRARRMLKVLEKALDLYEREQEAR